MPNTNWSILTSLQLGKYAEYYAKMELASYGLDVYTSEVDDHGIDFIAKVKNIFIEIQVKSVRNLSYVFLQKDKWDINSENTFLALILFEENKLPKAYLIPATAWKKPDRLLCDKNYSGLKSKPEYGINLSIKNESLLEQYEFEKTLRKSELISE